MLLCEQFAQELVDIDGVRVAVGVEDAEVVEGHRGDSDRGLAGEVGLVPQARGVATGLVALGGWSGRDRL